MFPDHIWMAAFGTWFSDYKGLYTELNPHFLDCFKDF